MAPSHHPPALPDPDADAVARLHAALAPARARLAARDGEVLRTQVQLTEIPAPTGEEGERAAWVAGRFRALGLAEVHTDAVGNVVARRPGAPGRAGRGLAPVTLCAHLDTVFPRDVPVAVRRVGRRLVGPGIGDNGRGLAALLALAEVVDGVRLRTRRPVEFVATVGEEGLGDLRGAKHHFAHAERPAAAIALDGAGDERVVHRALASRRFRVEYAGPGGHSWAAFGVPNAVHAAARCTTRLATLPLSTAPRVTLSVTRTGGGLSVNAIPAAAWLEVDLRATAPGLLDRYEQTIRRAAAAAAEEENAERAPGTPPVAVRVQVIGDRPGGETPADGPLVRAALAATRLLGRAPELGAASTDANVPLGLGVPALAIGAGGVGGDAHTPDEWFENAHGTVGIARALTIVVAAAGLDAAG